VFGSLFAEGNACNFADRGRCPGQIDTEICPLICRQESIDRYGHRFPACQKQISKMKSTLTIAPVG